MKKFAIHTDIDSSKLAKRVTEGRNISGMIYILADGVPFPAERWLDLPVIVLSWWLDGCLKIQEIDDPIDNSFMDGPFEFISVKNKGEVKLIFRKRTRQGEVEVIPALVITMDEYQNELIRSATDVLNILDNSSILGQDVDNLRGALNKLYKIRGVN